MRLGSMAAVLSALVCSATFANNIDMTGIQLNPGERVIAIDGVPVNSASGQQGQGHVRQAGFQPVRAVASNIIGNLVPSNQPFSHTPGETALDKANYERRKNGVGNLTPDPQLQALALQKAQIAAARGHKNHIGGSLGGARAEGVGHTNGRFLSCCLDMPATYGGAAMVQGRDGWYCCLLVR